MAVREDEADPARRGRVAATGVAALLADLDSPDDWRRETAVVRLRVAGERAVTRLCQAARVGSVRARAGALRALESDASGRGKDAALQVLAEADPAPEVAEAAVRVAALWLERDTGARVLEALVATVMRPSSDPRVVAAAREALAALPEPLTDLGLAPPRAADGSPETDPIAIQAWLDGAGRGATVPELVDLLSNVSDAERLALPALRTAWATARGTIHARLATLGSRAALQDLRETFERATEPVPPGFITAAAAIGDQAVLEALAHAWATVGADPWWRGRLADAGAAITRRLGLTGRHAAVRRLRLKYGAFV